MRRRVRGGGPVGVPPLLRCELGLDVHLAKVATYEGRVVDSFYVRDAMGRKLRDAPEELDHALRVRLEA